MKMKYISGLALSAFMLAALPSCQLLNKYESPEADVDNLFRESNSTDTTTIADIPWGEFFQDANLRALIGEGLENNYDLKMAVTRIQQAEASLGMARAAYFPNVALVGNVEHTRYSQGDDGKDVLGYHKNTYALGVAVSWELDVWGKMNRQSRASYAQFLSSHAYRNLLQTSLISNIASSYYALLALDKQLSITKETILLLEESAETMAVMKDAGMLSAAAVEQSKALLYGTQVSVPALESQIRSLENSICLMLGRKPGPVVRSTIEEQVTPGVLTYGIPVQMLSRRPDVMQAELSFRSAFELTHAAQASFYPSITLSSGTMAGYSATALSGFFKPENIFASIIGGLAQPLFARKQLTTQLRVAKAQQQEALLNFEKTVLTAGKEVSDILYTYESSLRKNEIRSKQIESVGKSVDYTRDLLVAGEANYTEVLSAAQTYLQALLGEVSDKLEQLQSAVSLYRALGGGTK